MKEAEGTTVHSQDSDFNFTVPWENLDVNTKKEFAQKHGHTRVTISNNKSLKTHWNSLYELAQNSDNSTA